MSSEQLILLLLVAVVANVVLSAAYLLAPGRTNYSARGEQPPRDLNLAREPDRFGAFGHRNPEGQDVAMDVATNENETPEAKGGLTPAAYDRVARIVGYAFLAAVAVVVATSGLYPRTAAAIYVVLGIAALLVLLVHDVLPSSALGPGKLVLEGSGAIALVTVLIALTGGATSPFFFGYYLIVAATALVLRGPATSVVAAGISLVYIVAIVALPGFASSRYEDVLRLAFNVVSLWLLAYLASVVAREQRRTRDAALRLSLFDPLTKLHNRGYFFAAMEREIQRAARTGRRFCLLMIDLDDLKPINDTFGHHYGDRILRAVGDTIRAGIRTIDSAARFGGDEFIVLLPETDPTGGFVVGEKLRRSISDIRVDAAGQPVRTTASIGVVAFPDDGTNAEQLMMSADATMYESKRKGKNRVAARSGRPRAREPRPSPAERPAPRRARPAAASREEPSPAAQPSRRERPAAPPPAVERRARDRGQPTAEPTRREPPSAGQRGGRRADSEAGAASTARGSRRTPRERSAVERPRPTLPPGEDEGRPGRAPRATKRFQILGDDDEEQIGRIMGQLLGTYTGPTRITPLERRPPNEADNRPA